MHTCRSGHQKCSRVHNDPQWRPSRLIDVGWNGPGDKVFLRLRAEVDQKMPYITLSHCWGSKKFLQLTTESLSNFEHGISTKTLPKTFKDAIVVTRQLGYRYIWIDSLCIMQDPVDSADWLREAGMMDLVYTGSDLNLAATAAEDSTKGLFYDRGDVKTLNPPTEILPIGGHPPQAYRIVDNGMWSSDIDQAPLIRRAWVLQERLLASRVLHFGKRQLFWECCETDAAEVLAQGPLPGRNSMVTNFKNLDDPERFVQENSDGRAFMGLERRFWPIILWTYIVEIYSAARLTKSEDKLIALSGIAKRMQSKINSHYFAGLWRTFFELQLLWHVESDGSSRLPEYRAPSWSWAKVDGKICQPRVWNDKYVIAHLTKEPQVDNTFGDEYGMVSSGLLVLNGYLANVNLLPNSTSLETSKTWTLAFSQYAVHAEIDPSTGEADPDIRLDFAKEFRTGASETSCMPLYYNPVNCELRGLLLRRKTDVPVFERIGTFWTWLDKNCKLILAASHVPDTRSAHGHLRGASQVEIV